MGKSGPLEEEVWWLGILGGSGVTCRFHDWLLDSVTEIGRLTPRQERDLVIATGVGDLDACRRHVDPLTR